MKFYEICRDMASRKNNQETSKQSTLLRWVRPDREPWKTENRGEQAVLEETSQESDEQAAGTSNTSNSNHKDLNCRPLQICHQCQKAPINRRTLNFPKERLETVRRNVHFNQCGSNRGHGYIMSRKLTWCYVSLV